MFCVLWKNKNHMVLETTWGWINADRSFISAWTIHLSPKTSSWDKEAQTCSLTCSMAEIREEQIDGVRYFRFKVVSCGTVRWAAGSELICCCLFIQCPEVRWIYVNRQAWQHWQREEWRLKNRLPHSAKSSSSALGRGSEREKACCVFTQVCSCSWQLC